MMAEHVSGMMIPSAWGEMPVENLRSCRLLPVARYLNVAISLCSKMMAWRITVSCLIIKGDRRSNRRWKTGSVIRRKFLKSSGLFSWISLSRGI